ncbi:MAG TPA: hypothetical protein VGN39_14880 [Terriglobales bacterium]|nr:hypothetical protein [Terriglobales bacterium]
MISVIFNSLVVAHRLRDRLGTSMVCKEEGLSLNVRASIELLLIRMTRSLCMTSFDRLMK